MVLQQSRDEVFEYCKLSNSSDCVRLLKICDIGGEAAFLQCTLEEFRLASLPPYKALSYTWGCPFWSSPDSGADGDWTLHQKTISCNSKTFDLSRNLFEAIRQLGTLGYTYEYFWVDAICINQKDIEERNAQVSLMSAIYSKATKVIVWLGAHDDDSQVAFHLLETFGNALRSLLRKEGWESLLLLDPNDESSMLSEKLGMPLPPESAWIAYHRFFQRGWFNRTWVIQEIALAKDVMLHCGADKIEWSAIIRLNYYLQRSPWRLYFDSRLDKYEEKSHGRNESIAIMRILRDICEGGRDKIEHWRLRAYSENGEITQAGLILEVLDSIQPSTASDPRDKIYGAIGLIKHLMRDNFDPAAIQPDYNCSTANVYTNVTAYLVTKTSFPTILSFVEHGQERLAGLPSWVPDFSSPAFLQSRFGYACAGPRKLYKTSVVTSKSLTMRQVQDSTLILNARYFKELIVVLPPIKASFLETELSELRDLLQFCHTLPATYFNGQNRIEAVWRTILGDSDDSKHPRECPVGRDLGQQFFAWLLNILAYRSGEDIEIFKETSTLLYEFFDLDFQWPSTVDKLRLTDPQYVREINPMILTQNTQFVSALNFLGRRICRIRDGLIGLCPVASQANDQIWLLENAAVPFILRPLPGYEYYQLVGECYVHGIMQGELMDDGLEFSSIFLV